MFKDLSEIIYKRRMVLKRIHEQGFTLVELIVALAIVAVIGVLATVGLRSVLQTRTHLTKSNEHITELLSAVSLLQQDTRAAIARPIINAQGHHEGALQSLQPNGFALTRQGSKKLQRVAYQVINHELVRFSWKHLDQAPNAKPIKQVLLKNVRKWQVEFVMQQGGAAKRWPLATGTNAEVLNQASVLPLAVSIKLFFKDNQQLPLLLPLRGRGYHA